MRFPSEKKRRLTKTEFRRDMQHIMGQNFLDLLPERTLSSRPRHKGLVRQSAKGVPLSASLVHLARAPTLLSSRCAAPFSFFFFTLESATARWRPVCRRQCQVGHEEDGGTSVGFIEMGVPPVARVRESAIPGGADTRKGKRPDSSLTFTRI